MAAYTVTAPLVVVLTRTGVRHLYHGDVVPADVKPESIDNLKALGFVSSDYVEPPAGTPLTADELASVEEHEKATTRPSNPPVKK